MTSAAAYLLDDNDPLVKAALSGHGTQQPKPKPNPKPKPKPTPKNKVNKKVKKDQLPPESGWIKTHLQRAAQLGEPWWVSNRPTREEASKKLPGLLLLLSGRELDILGINGIRKFPEDNFRTLEVSQSGNRCRPIQ